MPPPDGIRRARRHPEINLPNGLTTLRLVLIPIFGHLWLSGHHPLALAIFLIAALTDLLDGLLARWLDQRTELGALLDPAADKLTLLVAFVVGASVAAIPWWLAALVIGRDLLLTSGAGAYTLAVHGRYRRGQWRPTRLGKYATFYQLATIGLALLARAADLDDLRRWVGALALITAALTILSAVQYLSGGVRSYIASRNSIRRGTL